MSTHFLLIINRLLMRDAERLGIMNWMIKARNRDGWR
jgi:hypothetical protein